MTNSIETQMETLATQMGVDTSDVKMLVESVINSLKEDKADQAFIDASEEMKTDLMQAYVAHAVKKFQSFVTIYLTRGREDFNNTIYALVKS